MKLKDVFNLNLNTRGGVKLFDKIANKYNLIKSDRKNLVEVVNKGEGSSSDMEYYKTLLELGKEEFVALYKCKIANGIKISGLPEEYSHQTIAIAYAPITYEGKICYSIKDYFKSIYPDFTDEEIEYEFARIVTPITKEEFYDLNNI